MQYINLSFIYPTLPNSIRLHSFFWVSFEKKIFNYNSYGLIEFVIYMYNYRRTIVGVFGASRYWWLIRLRLIGFSYSRIYECHNFSLFFLFNIVFLRDNTTIYVLGIFPPKTSCHYHILSYNALCNHITFIIKHKLICVCVCEFRN